MQILNKKILIIAVITAVIGLGFASLYFFNQPSENKVKVAEELDYRQAGEQYSAAQSGSNTVTSVEVEKITKGDLAVYLTLIGETFPNQESEIMPRLEEEVKVIKIDVGDLVAKGDLLIELDSREENIDLKQAKASLASAQADLQDELNGPRDEEVKQLEADLKSAKSDLKLAKEDYQRNKELYEKEFISKQTFESFLNEYISAQSSYESAEQKLKLTKAGSTEERIVSLRAAVNTAEADVEAAELELSRSKITAPISGIVSDLNIDVGETTTSSTVATISQINRIRVKVYLSQSNVNLARVGEQVDLYFSALDKRFIGTIKNISPVADSDKKSFPVEITVDNPGGLIKAGMYAEVKLKTDQVEDKFIVPESAILKSDDNNYFFIVEADQVKKITADIILESNSKVAVKNDLEVGTEVVVNGEEYLTNGSWVNVINRGDQDEDS